MILDHLVVAAAVQGHGKSVFPLLLYGGRAEVKDAFAEVHRPVGVFPKAESGHCQYQDDDRQQLAGSLPPFIFTDVGLNPFRCV